MFYGVASAPPVLVKGEALVWVVLEDGDRLQIADTVIRLEQPVAEEATDAEMRAYEANSRWRIVVWTAWAGWHQSDVD